MLQCPVRREMKKSKIAMLALCGILACGSAAGGAYALYSGISDTMENQFTIKAGKLNETDDSKIGMIEENLWNPENAKGLMPNQVVPKNPKFISSAEYEAWCIMKVIIPTKTMKVGGEDTASVYDLVNLEGLDTDNWVLLNGKRSNKDGTDSVYYYGYKKALKKGDKTSALFTALKVPDISELASSITESVNVSVFTVQTEGYNTIQDAFVTLGVQ